MRLSSIPAGEEASAAPIDVQIGLDNERAVRRVLNDEGAEFEIAYDTIKNRAQTIEVSKRRFVATARIDEPFSAESHPCNPW